MNPKFKVGDILYPIHLDSLPAIFAFYQIVKEIRNDKAYPEYLLEIHTEDYSKFSKERWQACAVVEHSYDVRKEGNDILKDML